MQAPAFSLRAFVVGILLSAFLAAACPYTVFLHHTAGMAADFITAGAVFLFFLLTGLANSALRRLRPNWALQTGELVLVYTMMVVASAIPTWGLIANLLPIIPGAFYYATPENNWAELIQPLIPGWMVPQDPLAIKYFYEGAPAETAIPWEAWFLPLAAWLVLILALYAVMLSTMVIIRKQWIEHERLVFPLTQLPLEMLQKGSGSVPPFFKNPLMWAGFALPFLLYSTHGLHHYFNFIPAIETSTELRLFRRTTLIRLFLSFPVIGFTYFINLDIAFSLWFFHLLARMQTGLFNFIGFSVPGHNETFAGAAIGTSPVVSHQAMGAMLILAAFSLWTARRHLREVFAKAIGGGKVDDSGEPLSYRSAVWTMLGGLVVIALWLNASGMPLWIAPLFVLCAFAVFFGLARIIAEGGVGFCRPQMIAPVFTVYGIGSEMMGPTGLISTGFTYAWAADIRTTVMVSSINGFKLADQVGLKRLRPFTWAIVAAVVIALLVSVATTLWLCYTYGGINMRPWFFTGLPRAVFGFVADKMNNPLDADIMLPRWIATGVGALLMGFLMYARQHILGWPLHYLGMPIGDTWVMSWVWASIMLGWLLKVVILKYGGVPLYRSLRPFFLGLVLGQISCVGVWMVIDIITGTVGNYVQIGSP
ncbi:MAG: hypothetical protein GKR89_31715 [Candidatus Latescibacteria bacterium]|nr:hypothetical protein [Candidatus Latescibacterota bacterium]